MSVRKIHTIFSISFLLFIMFSSASVAVAIELSAGWNTLYNWWMPSWNNGKIVTKENGVQIVQPTDLIFDPLNTVQFGPQIDLNLPYNLRFESQFMYGKYRFFGSSISGMGFGNPAKFSISSQMDSYYVAAHLRYFIFSYFNIIAGFQAHIYESINSITIVEAPLVTNFGKYELDIKDRNYGPTAGFGFNLKAAEFFFVLLDCYATILWGSETSEFTSGISNSGLDLPTDPTNYGSYYALGGNLSLTFLFYIKKINTKIGIGASYGVIKFFQKQSEYAIHAYDEELDHNMGINIIISYTFSTKRKRGQKIWFPRPNFYK